MACAEEQQPEEDGQLRGAYVQAWVWVDLDSLDEAGDKYPLSSTVTDEQLIEMAQEQYNDEGVCEVDDNAPVSRCPETD